MKILDTVFSKNNEIFRMASQSNLLPNFIVSIFIFFALWIGGRFLAISIITIPLSFLPDRSIIFIALAKAIRLIFVSGTIILAFFIWVRYMEKRPISTMGFSNKNVIIKYLAGFFIGITFMIGNTLILFALGTVHFEGFGFEKYATDIITSVSIMLLGYIVQSASEEIAVRGWLMPVIGARYNGIAAVFITSAMFGVIHLFNPNVTVISIINIVLAGIFMALMVLLQEDIWTVCGYHCGWNWALSNIFGYQISGYAPFGGSLFVLRIDGSDLISGGYFGPEAGIIATVFLTFGIIVLIKLIYSKSFYEKNISI